MDDLESINIESMEKRRADLARRSAAEFDRAVFRGEMGVKEAVEAAILAERERCARIVDQHKPDASFDDSADGVMERNALLLNIARAIREGEA